MRVLFLAKMIQDRVLTPYNMYVLSAQCRKAGHETDIVDAVGIRHARRAIKTFRPDVLAFSTHTARWPFFRGAAKRLKEEFGLPQFFGGVHPTFRPNIVEEPFIDGVCMGEGDEAFPELLDRMEAGKDYRDVANWCFYKDGGMIKNPLRPLMKNLDNLPVPHFELTDRYHYSRESPLRFFLTSRGCMFCCSFCSTSGYTRLYGCEGKDYYRKSPVAKVIGEIEYVMKKYPCEFITFFDDHLTRGDEWTLEFAEAYRKIGGPPFSCHMVVHYIEREEIRALVRAGMRWVGMSLEISDPEFRRNILNRHYSNEKFKEAVAILSEEGVRTYVGNVIGFPGSTLKQDIESLHLNREAGVGLADASIFTPFPGTPLGERAFKEKLINEKHFFSRYHSLDASFHGPMICDVPHKRYMRRLQCLFEIAGDSGWVARNLRILVRLPLTPLYVLLYKLHNTAIKRFVLFKGLRLPLQIQLSLLYHNILQI
ncbi:MAG: radical SAM protein [bacterium]